MIRPANVLVVEDEPLAREMVEILMTDLGHHVTSCASGGEAIALSQDSLPPFDVILMDVQMPGMDGVEATRQLRANHRTSQVPIVCISAKANVQTREDGLLAGCDCYLIKPLHDEQIFTAITDVLRRRGFYNREESFS